MATKLHQNTIIALFTLLPLALYTLGEFLGCYYMITGSSAWCEPIVALF